MFNQKLNDRYLKLQKQRISDNELDPSLVDDLQSHDKWITPKGVDVSEVEAEEETHVNENNEVITVDIERTNNMLTYIGDKETNIINEENFEYDFDINYEDSFEDNQSKDETALGLDPNGVFYF
ncbi:hypothetical protein M5K25_019566 [Dendrobium thyrsiflorum]|uniref:Uncharacterized protein n=1 Tax=Dendrobium thyrsiflorum TaxID=117978 RepID=A0ABD0UM38_DENTH